MGLDDIIQMAERIGDHDERRRATFRQELDQYEAGAVDSFTETREVLATERRTLEELDRGLAEEKGSIGELTEYADFLTVEQAVEHRDETVEKLEKHNEHLQTFCEEMTEALAVVETNLDALETDGQEAVEADPQSHFERAAEALERHNEAVEGLGKNMTILNAYLV